MKSWCKILVMVDISQTMHIASRFPLRVLRLWPAIPLSPHRTRRRTWQTLEQEQDRQQISRKSCKYPNYRPQVTQQISRRRIKSNVHSRTCCCCCCPIVIIHIESMTHDSNLLYWPDCHNLVPCKENSFWGQKVGWMDQRSQHVGVGIDRISSSTLFRTPGSQWTPILQFLNFFHWESLIGKLFLESQLGLTCTAFSDGQVHSIWLGGRNEMVSCNYSLGQWKRVSAWHNSCS